MSLTQTDKLRDQHLWQQYDLYRATFWNYPVYVRLTRELKAAQQIEMLDLCINVLTEASRTWAKRD